MGLFDRLFRRKQAPPAANGPPEQAVIIRFTYGSTDLSRLFDLEEQLESLIAVAGVGEFDGNEVSTDGGDATLFMYGPDADALFAAVRPTLLATGFMRGARATLRYGPPAEGVREVEHLNG